MGKRERVCAVGAGVVAGDDGEAGWAGVGQFSGVGDGVIEQAGF